jgi:hypothetical protein
MNTPFDRLKVLLDKANTSVTGIDFIEVDTKQEYLNVHFYRTNTIIPRNLLPSPDKINVKITSLSKSKYSVIPSDNKEWVEDNVLKIYINDHKDFTLYRLTISNEKDDPYFNNIDPYFKNAIFSFKVNCPSDFDCKAKEHECPPDPKTDFPVDYMARDFWSYRRALLDFASARYPGWKDRLEADAGMMLLEMMSAMGDEMAYYQDRIGREAYLETATQRRSVRRHARLIDYDIDDGEGSVTWLDCQIDPDEYNIDAGTNVYSLSENGERIDFEIGTGLEDSLSVNKYLLKKKWNSLEPYAFDENAVCLPVGCTEMYIDLLYTDAADLKDKWVLLETSPQDASIPVRRHMVKIISVEKTTDHLNQDHEITHITWEDARSLPFEMCMKCNLKVKGNMVPVTAGKRYQADFIVGGDRTNTERAVEREGHDGTVTYLVSLTESENMPFVRTMNNEGILVPQIYLVEMIASSTGELYEKSDGKWDCRKSLIGNKSSDPDDRHFTLDDGLWKRVVGYQRNGKEIIHQDYTTGTGTTIRFGDGEFGKVPPAGTIFRVTYRLGGGAKSNVPADSIKKFEGLSGILLSVRNPFPATNGRDPESLDQVRELAPYRFQSVPECAVLAEDYAMMAERLEWVQRAGASFRWTGSWLSAFVTPDPRDEAELAEDKRRELVNHLDRYRQTGKEVHVMKPVYADIDLEIDVCVAPGFYKGDVEERVFEKLFGKGKSRRTEGYFSPDHYTFGNLLDRTTLEAAIQSVPGVNAVMKILYGRRGFFPVKEFIDAIYDPGIDTIIRIENDPMYPERGTVTLNMHGGI